MSKRVTYPAEMRRIAKESGKQLLTIDTPCITYQTPATPEMIAELETLFHKWARQRENAKPKNSKVKS